MFNFKVSKFNINPIIIALLVFPIFKPDSLEYIAPMVDTLYDAARIVSVFIVVLLLIRRRKRLAHIAIPIILLELWVIFTTAVNHGHVSFVIINFIAIMALIIVIDCFADDMPSLISGMLFVFEFLLYVSLLCILRYYPEGMYRMETTTTSQYYFLGNRNAIIFYALPAFFLAISHARITGNWIRAAALITATYIQIFIVWSATSIVVLILFAMLYFIGKKEWVSKISLTTVFVVLSIISFLVVGVGIIDRIPALSNLVSRYLGKSMTMSGRTYIWSLSLALIKKNLLIGLGAGSHVLYHSRYYTGHNQFLNLLLEGGIPQLLLFVALILYITMHMWRIKRPNSSTYQLLFIIMFCYFVEFIAEARLTADFFLVCYFTYYINLVDECCIQKARTKRKVKIKLLKR